MLKSTILLGALTALIVGGCKAYVPPGQNPPSPGNEKPLPPELSLKGSVLQGSWVGSAVVILNANNKQSCDQILVEFSHNASQIQVQKRDMECGLFKMDLCQNVQLQINKDNLIWNGQVVGKISSTKLQATYKICDQQVTLMLTLKDKSLDYYEIVQSVKGTYEILATALGHIH